MDDPDYQQLAPESRLVLLTVRLCKQAGPGVIFRYYTELIAAQAGLTTRRVTAALSELVRSKWIEIEGSVLWVRNGLRYDPSMRLGDRKHRLAVERAVAELPRVPIVLRFCDYYEIARPFEGPSKGIPSLALRIPNTEEDRIPNTESKSSPRQAEEDWPSPEALVALYNAKAPDECAAVTKLSPGRRKKAREYLAAFPDRKFWEDTCAHIRASRFLRGLRPSSTGHESFVADFDWLLSKGKDGSENCLKVYEGKYHG